MLGDWADLENSKTLNAFVSREKRSSSLQFIITEFLMKPLGGEKLRDITFHFR